jgi:mannose-6-phosphate isomerase-like protein (cupin superfamily)
MIEHITHGQKTLAIILSSNFRKDGIEFFTPPEFSQQLAYMKRDKGYAIPPHVHNPVPREVRFTHEVLFVKSGKVRVDFYEQGDVYLESRVLLPGDVILLCDGGHGFTMLEESEMIEVKQGPYAGEDDKRRFKAVDEHHVVLKD